MEMALVRETEGRTLSKEERARLSAYATKRDKQAAESEQKRRDRLTSTVERLRRHAENSK